MTRFWAKVSVSTPSGCWEWRGCLNHKNYGMFRINGTSKLAHRVAHELVIGPIPDGMQVDHLCFNHTCVNPAHLEAVTPLENTRRALAAGRMVYHSGADHHNVKKTHCPHGHPYADNVYFGSNGARRCCTCREIYELGRRPQKLAYLRAYKARKRQAAMTSPLVRGGAL